MPGLGTKCSFKQLLIVIHDYISFSLSWFHQDSAKTVCTTRIWYQVMNFRTRSWYPVPATNHYCQIYLPSFLIAKSSILH